MLNDCYQGRVISNADPKILQKGPSSRKKPGTSSKKHKHSVKKSACWDTVFFRKRKWLSDGSFRVLFNE